jgi:hypothetical protein
MTHVLESVADILSRHVAAVVAFTGLVDVEGHNTGISSNPEPHLEVVCVGKFPLVPTRFMLHRGSYDGRRRWYKVSARST